MQSHVAFLNDQFSVELLVQIEKSVKNHLIEQDLQFVLVQIVATLLLLVFNQLV